MTIEQVVADRPRRNRRRRAVTLRERPFDRRFTSCCRFLFGRPPRRRPPCARPRFQTSRSRRSATLHAAAAASSSSLHLGYLHHDQRRRCLRRDALLGVEPESAHARGRIDDGDVEAPAGAVFLAADDGLPCPRWRRRPVECSTVRVPSAGILSSGRRRSRQVRRALDVFRLEPARGPASPSVFTFSC